MEIATLGSRNRVTLPKAVREAIDAVPGDKIRFMPAWNGFDLVVIKRDIDATRAVMPGSRKNRSPSMK